MGWRPRRRKPGGRGGMPRRIDLFQRFRRDFVLMKVASIASARGRCRGSASNALRGLDEVRPHISDLIRCPRAAHARADHQNRQSNAIKPDRASGAPFRAVKRDTLEAARITTFGIWWGGGMGAAAF